VPVTGPFFKNEGSLDKGFVTEKGWWRSTHPRPILPYDSMNIRFTRGSGNGYAIANSNTYQSELPSNDSAAYAMAFDRFVNRLGPRVQVALNALEIKQTQKMVLTRMIQLRRLYTSVRNRDFSGVIRSISDDGTGSKKRLTKRHLLASPSGFWLEIQFGWLPVIQDIFTGVEVMQTQFPSSPIRARGKSEEFYLTFGWCPTNRSSLVEISSEIRITNPNLFLANQLGVINPAHVAWDAVPGSFIFDWFIPVGKFLQSFSAFAGVELVRPRVTKIVRGSFSSFEPPGDTPNNNFSGSFFRMKRLDNWSGTPPTILSRAHLPQVNSWLLATEVSLVAQALSRRLK